MSINMRDLVKEAIEIEEDIRLADIAEKREKSFAKSKAVKHNEVW